MRVFVACDLNAAANFQPPPRHQYPPGSLSAFSMTCPPGHHGMLAPLGIQHRRGEDVHPYQDILEEFVCGDFAIGLPALGQSFALSLSKDGIALLPPGRNLLRVGGGNPLDDGRPLRAAFRGAHVGFVVVVKGF